MTTIAYDGRYVAADSLVMSGGCKLFTPHDKIVVSKDGDRLYGLVGTGPALTPWIEWYEIDGPDQKNGPKLPQLKGDCEDGNFIVFDHERGWQMFSIMCPYAVWRKEPHAWGSGGDYAIGALCYDANAYNAVRVAAKRDPYTDDRIKVYDLKNKEFV